jgi:hypothetical protein
VKRVILIKSDQQGSFEIKEDAMAQLCKKKKIRRLLHISQNKILSDT